MQALIRLLPKVTLAAGLAAPVMLSATVTGCSHEDVNGMKVHHHGTAAPATSAGKPPASPGAPTPGTDPDPTAGPDSPGPGPAPGQSPSPSPTSGPEEITKTIDNSGAGFQVKDVDLLRSSMISCMGSDMLKITSDMLFLPQGQTSAPLPDAKIRFLLPGSYTAGDDILEKERGNMIDPALSARTTVLADSLTDTYLRSLETIANVVAHNCSLDKEECKCATKEDAQAMLARCLPGLDPETKEMDTAAEMLGDVCAYNGVEGMRKAIASMLSSYAFASAR